MRRKTFSKKDSAASVTFQNQNDAVDTSDASDSPAASLGALLLGTPSHIIAQAVTPDMAALKERVEAAYLNNLAAFKEFQAIGHNLLFPKPADIDGVLSRLQAMSETTLESLPTQMLKHLKSPAVTFLNSLRTFRDSRAFQVANLDDAKTKIALHAAGSSIYSPDHEALRQANRMVKNLSEALDLIQALNDRHAYTGSWQKSQEHTLAKLREDYVPADGSGMEGIVRSLMEAKLTDDHPENILFNRLVNAVSWEEREVRQALDAQLKNQAKRISMGIEFATDYERTLPRQSNLAKSFRDVCSALSKVIKPVHELRKMIEPSKQRLPEAFRVPAKGVLEQIKTLPEHVESGFSFLTQKTKQTQATLEHGSRIFSGKVAKTFSRFSHSLNNPHDQFTTEAMQDTSDVILQVGTDLSNRIQQAHSTLYTVKNTASPLRQAVTLSDELIEGLTRFDHFGFLNAPVLAESARWDEKAKEAEKHLQDTLEDLTPLAQALNKNTYVLELLNLLEKAPKDEVSQKSIGKFKRQIYKIIATLASVESDMRQNVLSLSRLGKAGDEALNTCMARWNNTLTQTKNLLKAHVAEHTGYSLDNFTPTGMLAREVGELSSELRGDAGSEFDQLFLDVVEAYLPLLSTEDDPEGKYLFNHIGHQVRNAAQGTLLYPSSMDEILTGMKSTHKTIKDWSRKRLARGFLLAACLQPAALGWKVAALPFRVAIKFVITGAKIGYMARRGQQGIKVGEGPVRDEVGAAAQLQARKTIIKMLITFPPGLDALVGMATVFEDIYEDGVASAAKKIAKSLVSEAPWQSVGPGMKAVNAYQKAHLQNHIEPGIRELLEAADKDQSDPSNKDMEHAFAASGESGGETDQALNVKDELWLLAKSENAELKKMALHLLDKFNDDELDMQQSTLEGRSSYSLSKHRIIISANALDWERLHEIAHGMTARKLRYGLNNPTSRLGPLALRIDALRKRAENAYEGPKSGAPYYYLSSPEEFVAGLYSGDSALIDHLRAIDSEGKSLLSLVMDALFWLLDLTPKQASAFTEAMGLTDELLGSAKLTTAELGETRYEVDRLFSADKTLIAPTGSDVWVRIGQKTSPSDLPIGKKLQVTLTSPWGTQDVLDIDIPDDLRKEGKWLSYVAQYTNAHFSKDVFKVNNIARAGIDAESGLCSFDVYLHNDFGSHNIAFAQVDGPPRASLVAWGLPIADRYAWLYRNEVSRLDEWEVILAGGDLQPDDEAELRLLIADGKKMIERLKSDMSTEKAFVEAMSLRAEPLVTSGDSATDAFLAAIKRNVVLKKQLAALRKYQPLHDETKPSQADVDQHRARVSQLESVSQMLAAQQQANDRLIGFYNERAQPRVVTTSTTAWRRKFKALADLYTTLNRITALLTYDSMRGNILYIESFNPETYHSDGIGSRALPDRFEISGTPGLIEARNKTEQAIQLLTASMQPTEDEKNVALALEAHPLASPSVETDSQSESLSVPRSAYDTLRENGKKQLDEWIVESANEKGFDIDVSHLDQLIKVFVVIGVHGTSGTRYLKRFTLRQILLGEADRSIFIGAAAATGLAIPNDHDEPLIELLQDRSTRLGVADGVMARIDDAVDRQFALPQVQQAFKQRSVGSIFNSLKEHLDQLENKNPLYFNIVKNYFLGGENPVPVYVNGKAVPGVMAIGHGDFHIAISLDTRKIMLFNTPMTTADSSDFLQSHLAALDRLSDPTISPTITFGDGTENVYAIVHKANADKLKSNLGGVVFTREEADYGITQEMKKALVASAEVLLMIATVGASAPVQFAIGLAASMASFVVDIIYDQDLADNSDRIRDRKLAEADVHVGKIMMGVNLLIPFLSSIKLAKSLDELGEALKDVGTLGGFPKTLENLGEGVEHVGTFVADNLEGHASMSAAQMKQELYAELIEPDELAARTVSTPSTNDVIPRGNAKAPLSKPNES